jgi:hypothetical protein
VNGLNRFIREVFFWCISFYQAFQEDEIIARDTGIEMDEVKAREMWREFDALP